MHQDYSFFVTEIIFSFNTSDGMPPPFPILVYTEGYSTVGYVLCFWHFCWKFIDRFFKTFCLIKIREKTWKIKYHSIYKLHPSESQILRLKCKIWWKNHNMIVYKYIFSCLDPIFQLINRNQQDRPCVSFKKFRHRHREALLIV